MKTLTKYRNSTSFLALNALGKTHKASPPRASAISVARPVRFVQATKTGDLADMGQTVRVPDMSISAVVPTLHRPELMKRCCQSLLRDPQLSELLICIDGPDTQSRYVADLMAESDSRVQRVQPTRHQGRMHARQNGLEAASGDVVLFVDDDVVATSHLATNHGARHRLGEGRVVMGYMGVPTPNNTYERIYSREYEATFERLLRGDSVLDSLWGGNISLRRQDAASVGVVSTGFEDCYFEDRDFGLRCKQAGLVGVLAPEATADHHHSRSAERFVREAFAMGKGAALLHDRHPDALGNLHLDSFKAGIPAPFRPLVSVLAVAPDAVCVSLLKALSPGAKDDQLARLIRRAKQLAGARS